MSGDEVMPGFTGEKGAEAMALKGGCFCGKVAFTIEAPCLTAFACHCTNCQRLQGAPYTRYAYFPPGAIKPDTGSEEFAAKFNSSENLARYHCRVCGSPVWGVNSAKGFECMGCPIAALERGPDGRFLGGEGIKLNGHVFYDSRVADVDDGVPKHAGYPPEAAAVDFGAAFKSG
ncbi:unnamed protein product [Ostreobium quekettii]|uniref:CENP-V/GFA domain-containing protein n=1 Tax=Ostreobium quekettii TaxID=121088 RepID=A0A8S1JH73_9CHLO|nr:unnamed protein product [Ostreobium quekettii]